MPSTVVNKRGRLGLGPQRTSNRTGRTKLSKRVVLKLSATSCDANYVARAFCQGPRCDCRGDFDSTGSRGRCCPDCYSKVAIEAWTAFWFFVFVFYKCNVIDIM